jgi:hypothetical protein
MNNMKYLAIGNRDYTNKVRRRGLNWDCIGWLGLYSPRLTGCDQFPRRDTRDR